jgi:hypothetical protein
MYSRQAFSSVGASMVFKIQTSQSMRLQFRHTAAIDLCFFAKARPSGQALVALQNSAGSSFEIRNKLLKFVVEGGAQAEGLVGCEFHLALSRV